MSRSFLPKAVRDTIDAFASLPGIGPKSAGRLTFFLLKSNEKYSQRIASAIENLKSQTVYCSSCYNIASHDPCPICQSSDRTRDVICVVSEALDMVALEKTGKFKGRYHVLHGEISPINGVGPDDIKIQQLVERVRKGGVIEVILATNPTIEGETTAMYIAKLLSPYDLKVTRIARGLPVGGDLEYADEITLSNALDNRRDFDI